MSWTDEFKAFALKGNMIDLAIGVVIGTAFGKVVSSLVSDIIMPPIGLLLGGVDFSALSVKLRVPETSTAPVEIQYGLFINTLINFFIISLAIFAVIKAMNKLKIDGFSLTKTKDCPECCTVIPIKAKKCPYCQSELAS